MPRCIGCKKEKPEEEFYSDGRGGKKARCGKCVLTKYPRSTRKQRKVIKDQADPAQDTQSFMEEVATAPIFQDKKTIDSASFPDGMGAFTARQKALLRESAGQITAEILIPVDKPVALTFLSDAHLGSPYTAYDALMKDLDDIRNHPRHYLGLGGDMIDNFQPGFKDKSASVWQLEPPQIQLIMLEKLMKFMDGSIIASIGGNHDKMDKRSSGQSQRYFIQRNKPFPYLPYGGKIQLTVGKIPYTIIWKHTWRFNSALNKFNIHHRINDLLYQADITVTEHQHDPGIESIERGEYDQKRTAISIRTGSYKIDDPFSMEYFKAGRRGPQTVILWPDEKQILALHGEKAIEHAQTYLKGLG